MRLGLLLPTIAPLVAVLSWTTPSEAQSAPAPAPVPAPSADQPPGASPAPFGAGSAVEFTANKPWLTVFVARGVVEDTTPRYPDPFVKAGRAPFVGALPTGTYTIYVEGPNVPTASHVVQVGDRPVHVDVHGGSDGVRGLSSLLLGVGATALLAATVLEVSYSPKPNGISKSAIAVPLFVTSAVGLGTGLTLYFVSGTKIEDDGGRSGGASVQAAVSAAAVW